ncbi:hypothetical protein FACS189443_5890 [Planctomycetales bacterium]|nr:hypothetical protein FACS189443_5890 [Planctomycetales bacterium]
MRLDYINPMEGADVLPDDKRNDITEVVMRSGGNYDYHYSAVSTTGIPFSNLFKSKTPYAALQMRFQADFNQNINALTALPGGKVVDLLQRKIKSVIKRPYENIANALWFTGEEIDTNTGNSSTWTLVLNPNQHYALLFHKAMVTGKQSGNSIIASGKIVSQTMQDGKILPKEIILEGEMPGRKTKERSVISVNSTDEPDAKLFTEESFKELGRDIAVVDVLPNQKQMPGRIVEAAPLETRMPDYSAFLIGQGTSTAWSWTRILLLTSGVIMVIIACILLYNRRK